MSQYEMALGTLKHLLDAVGERHWAEWVQADLEEWRSWQSTRRHRSAYGGMGSINDLVICDANKHRVTTLQEGWANMLLRHLLGLCSHLAQWPEVTCRAETLSRDLGLKPSFLRPLFVDSTETYHDITVARVGHELLGRFCGECGRADATPWELAYFIAQDMIDVGLAEAFVENGGLAYIDRALGLKLDGVDRVRADLVQVIDESGIALPEERIWREPCVACGAEHGIRCRWQLSNVDGLRFVLTGGNLPIVLAGGERRRSGAT